MYRFESAQSEKVGSGDGSNSSSESEDDESRSARALVLSLNAAATDKRPGSMADVGDEEFQK